MGRWRERGSSKSDDVGRRHQPRTRPCIISFHASARPIKTLSRCITRHRRSAKTINAYVDCYVRVVDHVPIDLSLTNFHPRNLRAQFLYPQLNITHDPIVVPSSLSFKTSAFKLNERKKNIDMIIYNYMNLLVSVLCV